MIKLNLNISHDEFILLACNAFHRASRARKAINEGRDSAAIANYFALDTNELSRAFAALDDELQKEIVDAVQNGFGEGK